MGKPYREYTPEDIYNMRFEITTLRKQLDQLKAENERLERQNEAERKDNWSVRGQLGEAECLLCRYDRTLTEIKEIAESVSNWGSKCKICELNKNCADCLDDDMQKILQKISEVENE